MNKKFNRLVAAFSGDLGFGAKLTRFLLSVNLLPISVDKNYQVARFSLTSKRTFLYLLMVYFPHLVAATLWISHPDFVFDYLFKVVEMFSLFETCLVLTFYTICAVTMPIFTLVFW